MKYVVTALKPYGLIVLTGGSSGIGKAILDSIISAELPISIANLSRTGPILDHKPGDFKHIPTDLEDQAAVRNAFSEVEKFVRERGLSGEILLINNSGFGCYGPFPEPSLEDNLKMIDVNLRAAVQLAGLFLPMIRKNGGGVVNIASTASFQPLSYMSVYAATKAYLLNWGLALHQELIQEGAFCLTVCPGPTATDFFNRAGFEGEPTKGMGQTPDQVVETMFRAIRNRKSLVTSGWMNWFLAGIGHTLPARWIAPLTAKMIRGLRLETFRKKDV